jgi:hypothetical protein
MSDRDIGLLLRGGGEGVHNKSKYGDQFLLMS